MKISVCDFLIATFRLFQANAPLDCIFLLYFSLFGLIEVNYSIMSSSTYISKICDGYIFFCLNMYSWRCIFLLILRFAIVHI